MPFVPREWWVWTCKDCESTINVSPHPKLSAMAREQPRCPYCGAHPYNPPPSRRAAIDDPSVGLIGSSETAGLDYLASIANSLVDIRNKLFAVHHVPDPIDVPVEETTPGPHTCLVGERGNCIHCNKPMRE